jgi:membrane-anchored glycerophosphoryl diester phosphodiesterase (GDPDase)
MTGLELRPLSMGEVLDRAFTLYRRHFLLFVALSGIPQLPVLGLRLAQIGVTPLGENPNPFAMASVSVLLLMLIFVGATLAFLFSQGATILAVADLYLGRNVTITDALRRVREDLAYLFGVIVLNFLTVGAAMIFLIVPGIYVACRLFIAVPVALIEKRSPSDSLTRSWDLTRDNAGRAFVVLVLYLVLVWAMQLVFALPFSFAAIANMNNPGAMRLWLALAQLGESAGTVLVTPILMIATSIFYYDLRVRKEAFDLQFLMDPTSIGGQRPPALPAIFG